MRKMKAYDSKHKYNINEKFWDYVTMICLKCTLFVFVGIFLYKKRRIIKRFEKNLSIVMYIIDAIILQYFNKEKKLFDLEWQIYQEE